MGFGVLDQQGSKRRCTWLMMHLSIVVCLKDMFNLQDAATTTLFVALEAHEVSGGVVANCG
jgi:hypothetical protein